MSTRLIDTFYRYKNKIIDTSLPFRLTNLPNGAKLDLVVKSKSAGVVQVALQLPAPYNGKVPPNGRILKKFPSTFSIWQVLRQFEESEEAKKAQLNITDRGVPQTVDSGAGQLYYEAPVLSAMGWTLEGFERFQQTLGQMGYNQGSVLMHLSFRQTDATLSAAMEDINKYFKETMVEIATQVKSESQSTPKEEPSSSTNAVASTASGVSTSKQKDQQRFGDAMDLDDPPSNMPPIPPPVPPSGPPGNPSSEDAVAADTNSDSLEPVSIYQAPSSSTPVAASAPFVEADFVPTIADAQRHQVSLQKETANRRLLSDKELEEQAASHEAKIAAVKSIEVKVRFPDNTSALWRMTPNDTCAKLYSCVRSIMADSSRSFKLILPPKTIIRDDDTSRLIKTYELTGKGVLINLVTDDVSQADRGRPFLKESAAKAAQQIVVPDIPEGKEEKIGAQPGVSTAGRGAAADGGSTSDQLKKLSKFFKLPGKK